MWQAVHVQGRLASLNPESEVVILGMTTKGDQILDRPLAEIGGKGLFIKELEVAMEEGRAHLAVHSMKDVPMVMPEGFVLSRPVKSRMPSCRTTMPRSMICWCHRRHLQLAPRIHPARQVSATGDQRARGNLDTRLKSSMPVNTMRSSSPHLFAWAGKSHQSR
jgi:porphobilinogen deaminase